MLRLNPVRAQFVKTLIISVALSLGFYSIPAFCQDSSEDQPLSTANSAGDFDQDLDLGSSPIPEENEGLLIEKEAPSKSKFKKLREKDFGRVIEEIEAIDPYRNALDLHGGLYSNYDYNEQPKRYAGAGFRYGFKLLHRLIFRGAQTQDQLYIEGGATFYQVIGYRVPEDSYSVVMTTLAGRYLVMFSRDFGVFGYLGTAQNIAFAGAEGDEGALSILRSTIPAVGGGFVIGIGPNWEIRTDIGVDALSAALVLRF